MNKTTFIKSLALSITCGQWDEPSIEKRIRFAISAETLDTARLSTSIYEKTKTLRNIETDDVVYALHKTQFFIEWIHKLEIPPKVIRLNLEHAGMNKNTSPFKIKTLPEITTYSALAQWLGLTENDLGWLADTRNIHANTKDFKLQHYHYKWIKRHSGALRLLETPKSCLKSMQRKILRDILDNITPHNAAHGFTKNRSCKTHAQIHCNQDMILHMDLANFFTSITFSKVYGIFQSIGYPKPIARTLAALCTNSPSPHLLEENYRKMSWQKQKLLTQAHLPQGAPTSPSLANLCCYWLDNRLEGLSKSMGIKYSRYADDLAFSGDKVLTKNITYLRKITEHIATEQGFQINHKKTYSAHKSEQQSLVGIVVNKHPNISRQGYDTLKAILYNCKKHGISSQNKEQHDNFKDHLRGKIAYIASINPSRGQKLEKIHTSINWKNT